MYPNLGIGPSDTNNVTLSIFSGWQNEVVNRPVYYHASAIAFPLTSEYFTILISGDLDNSLKIIHPLQITIEADEDGFIASDQNFYVYGVGGTLIEASEDYLAALSEYYENISEEAEITDETRALLNQLNKFIQKIGE